MMWAAQLRDYRHQTDKKSGKLTAKKETPQEGASNTAQGENQVAGVGGFSLYSSTEEEARSKDLDKCAQLLSDMMQAAPGLATRQTLDPRSSKILASKVKKTKAVKPTVVSRSKKVCDRASKTGAAPKKCVTKPGVKSKTREHAVDSVSETSTDLQVRLVGPKPLPLNNSETLVQLLGAQLQPEPRVQPGNVVMTKVPYNDRLLSSTPMSSPAANRHRAAFSMHSDHSGATARSHSEQLVPEAQPRQDPVSRPSTESAQVGSGLHMTPDNVSSNPQLVELMKRYVTQSDEYLTSFIQNCLAQGQVPTPQGHGNVSHQGQGSNSFQGNANSFHQGQGSVSLQGQGNMPYQGHASVSYQGQFEPQGIGQGDRKPSMPQSGSDLRGQNTGYTGLSTAPTTDSTHAPQPSVDNPSRLSTLQAAYGLTPQANPHSEVDIDAILKSHGIQLGANHTAVETRAELPGSAVIRDTAGKENLPPSYATAGETGPAGESVVSQQSTEDIDDDSHVKRQVHEEKSRSKKAPVKAGKKEKEKSKKKATTPVRLVTEKPSPADTKTQVRTLLYLFGELRAVTSVNHDREVCRLLADMEQMLTQLSPGLSTSGLGTDLDLALQPLRSENAQLRRRIRILTQRFKDKCHAVDEACKPDPSVQVIELELQRHSLETQVKESTVERERLQAAVTSLAKQVQGLMKERQNMLRLINTKDTDNMRSQQDWIGEASELRAQLRTAETARTELTARLRDAAQEKLMLEVTNKQKTKENERLRQLVKSLQGSMSRLLGDLKGTKPNHPTAVDDISRYIENIGTLLKTDKPVETPLDTKPTRDTVPPAFSASAPLEGILSSLMGDNVQPFGRPLQELIQAVPVPSEDPTGGEVKDGLQRAYELLDQIDSAISPHPKQHSPERTAQSKPTHRAKVEQKEQRRSAKSQESTPARKRDHEQLNPKYEEQLRHSPRKVHNEHKASPVEFDPDNDNYQGQLTQELLLEHDRQNGVDDEVIERMLIRSTRSQSQEDGPQRNQTGQNKTTEGSIEASRKSLYSLPKGMEGAQSSLEEPEIRLSLDKLPTLPTSDSEADKHSGISSLQSPFDMETTSYLNPPENLKRHGSPLKQRDQQRSTSGLTVKDLLAPFAERIMHSPAAKRASSYGPSEVSLPSSELSPATLSSETDEAGGEGETDGDDTLTLQDPAPGQKPVVINDDDSRYSVSDYFMKYPIPTHRSTSVSTAPDYPSSSHLPTPAPNNASVAPSAAGEQLQRDSTANSASLHAPADVTSTSFTTVTSAGSTSYRPARGPVHSPQDRLYRGTELDTSLSTIQEAESNSLLSASSVTSVSSLATVDEQDFKDGLAKLDANIARIQSSLKTQIGGYF